MLYRSSLTYFTSFTAKHPCCSKCSSILSVCLLDMENPFACHPTHSSLRCCFCICTAAERVNDLFWWWSYLTLFWEQPESIVPRCKILLLTSVTQSSSILGIKISYRNSKLTDLWIINTKSSALAFWSGMERPVKVNYNSHSNFCFWSAAFGANI